MSARSKASSAWLEDYAEVVKLAKWLVEQKRLDGVNGVLEFLETPWSWADERRVMLGEAFFCTDCDSIFDFDSDDDEQSMCSDCYESRKAEADAERHEADEEDRWDAHLERQGL